MPAKVEISNAEWEIMRLLWTLKSATSRQLIKLLSAKFQWKPATVKTLLRRLADKKIVRIEKNGRVFTYYPNIPEQETIEHQLMDSVGKICQMHVGRTLDEVIKEVPLTQDDILRLQETLKMKLRNAPTKLECNCLSCSQWKE